MGLESIFGIGRKKRRVTPSAEQIRREEQQKLQQESLSAQAEQEQARLSLRQRLFDEDEEEEISRKTLLGQ